MMVAHSTAVANEFIRLASSKGKTLTQMQLQKLVYIAHGWNLAINGSPLTSDEPCAWDYGPVYPELWESLRRYGRQAVTSNIKIGDFGFGMFSEQSDKASAAQFAQSEGELIERVFDIYGDFHAFQLSAMTHEEGTPWYQVYVQEGLKKAPILRDRIKEHFVDLARKRTAA